MPGCCSKFENAAGEQFNAKKVAKELARFRANGPGPTTRLLQQRIAQAGLLGGFLLDIGAGFGALTFRSLDRGMKGAVAVDAAGDDARERTAVAGAQLVPDLRASRGHYRADDSSRGV
jgi:hypothetical protein